MTSERSHPVAIDVDRRMTRHITRDMSLHSAYGHVVACCSFSVRVNSCSWLVMT